jgi:2-oxoglutarate ferredoxin oxidoreductase subunit gamma
VATDARDLGDTGIPGQEYAESTMNLQGKARSELRISGFGGQGVVLAGIVLGRAAAVHEGRNAVMAQSYGPESRGGASCAEVIIADGEIDYPHIVGADVVVALAQDAYNTYGKKRPRDALLICERDLVELDADLERGRELLRAPFTALAEKVGRKLVLNMVTLGFLCRATSVVSRDALRAAIAASVPKGTEELNLKAFEAGWSFAEAMPVVGGNGVGGRSELS